MKTFPDLVLSATDQKVAVCGIGGRASVDGSTEPLSSITYEIDDNTHLFVVPTGPPGGFAVSPKGAALAQGQVVTANITFHTKSQDGTALEDYTQRCILNGPPLPPQADTLFESVTITQTQIPADPGTTSGTIPVA